MNFIVVHSITIAIVIVVLPAAEGSVGACLSPSLAAVEGAGALRLGHANLDELVVEATPTLHGHHYGGPRLVTRPRQREVGVREDLVRRDVGRH